MKDQIKWLRILAYSEGISFLIILLVTMPLKYFYQTPMPNKVVGMGHGILFVGYVAFVFRVYLDQNWSIKKLTLALLASIVPFGTFWADARLFRN